MGYNYLEERQKLLGDPQRTLQTELEYAITNKQHPLRAVISCAHGLSVQEIRDFFSLLVCMAAAPKKLKKADSHQLQIIIKKAVANDIDLLKLTHIFYDALEKATSPALVAIQLSYSFAPQMQLQFDEAIKYVLSEDYETLAKQVPSESARMRLARIVGYNDRNRSSSQKPRPKNKTTHAQIFQREMRRWKKDGRTLENFIDAAKNNSVNGLSLVEVSPTLPRKFEVTVEDVPKEKKIKYATLQNWWTLANKKVTRK